MKKHGARTKKTLTAHLGETLRAARAQTVWTQADVAERVGVATEVYGRMERGQMDDKKLAALSVMARTLVSAGDE